MFSHNLTNECVLTLNSNKKLHLWVYVSIANEDPSTLCVVSPSKNHCDEPPLYLVYALQLQTSQTWFPTYITVGDCNGICLTTTNLANLISQLHYTRDTPITILFEKIQVTYDCILRSFNAIYPSWFNQCCNGNLSN